MVGAAIVSAGLVVLGAGGVLRYGQPATARAALASQEPLVTDVAADDGLPGFHGTALLGDSRTRASLARAARASRARARPPLRAKWVRPGTGVLTSTFAWRWGAFHKGIDLAAPFGAPIYAVGDGVVVRAGPANGYGNLILIRHDGQTVSAYGHEEAVLVTAGQRVHAGQIIALVGSRGDSTGPHLHFEVRRDLEGDQINPIPWLRERGLRV